ncbi:MAG: MarR family transcriptional regulator [Solirubrobacteraceae bacterium]
MLPFGKIGERLQVHPASVTTAVDRLEDQGWSSGCRTPQTAEERSHVTPR